MTHVKNGPDCTCPNDDFHVREIEQLRAERDAVIRECGEFKVNQREARSAWYAERDRLRAALEHKTMANCHADDGTHHSGCPGWERMRDEEVERLRAELTESERISGERLVRLRDLRNALVQIDTDSEKLGIAPGHLGFLARRALSGHKAAD